MLETKLMILIDIQNLRWAPQSLVIRVFVGLAAQNWRLFVFKESFR